MVNILIGKGIEDNDVDLFFGPKKDDDVVVKIDEIPHDKFRLLQLLKQIKAIQSINQLRNSKWDRDIPVGFSSMLFGKKKKWISILRIDN